MYKDQLNKIIADISTETLKVRRAWSEVFQALKETNISPSIFYSAKLTFKIDVAIKMFQCYISNS
jgi:hypothetical protein